MISYTHKFVYTHIQKCGGTSILKQIRPYVVGGAEISDILRLGFRNPVGYMDHSFFEESYNRLEPTERETFYKFSVVRNTYDRLGSRFNYGVMGKDPWYCGFCKEHGIETFEDFIMNIDFVLSKTKSDGRLSRSIEPVSDWLYIDGENYLDDIFTLDNLGEKWEYITEKIDIPYTPITKERVLSKTGKYREWYTPEMVDKVKKAYEQEIKTFKFEFDE